jgi:hypothetical protein
MRYLIAVDDTDAPEGRGTGFRARALGALLAERGLATTDGISRHQLFVDPRIPYTSHNSSLCLGSELLGTPEQLIDTCREFLARESAAGSDPGLCVAPQSAVTAEVMSFGRLAKTSVVDVSAAEAVALTAGLHLESVAGDPCGVIGALAAVGLRASGEDGRFVWVPGVREISGVLQADRLLAETGIDEIRDLGGAPVPGADMVDVDPWPRPVLKGAKAVLLVEPGEAAGAWRLAPREFIRTF